MSKKLFLIGLPILLLLSALYIRDAQFDSTSMPAKEVYKYVSSDYPVFEDIQQMCEQADCIVLGQYGEFLSTWNMDRNPENPVEEDPNSYSEGRLYSFNVEQVLKGEPPPDEITISKYYSFGSEYSVGKIDGVEQYAPCQIPTQYFVEPEYGVDYLLFLDYNEVADNYYAIGEPWEMAIRADGTADLKSNLFNPPPDMPATLETEVRAGDTVTKLIIGGTDIGRYENFLAGMTLDELEAEIASVVEEAPAA